MVLRAWSDGGLEGAEEESGSAYRIGPTTRAEQRPRGRGRAVLQEVEKVKGKKGLARPGKKSTRKWFGDSRIVIGKQSQVCSAFFNRAPPYCTVREEEEMRLR